MHFYIMEEPDPNVKSLFIDKGNGGFGFNIKGTTQVGGTLQSINGHLYPPLQYVSVVDPGNTRARALVLTSQGARHTEQASGLTTESSKSTHRMREELHTTRWSTG
jgi:hypothetical protein